MMDIKQKRRKLIQRKQRVRAKIKGTRRTPRLSVYRSLKHVYAQIIDDSKGETVLTVSDHELKKEVLEKARKEVKGSSQVIIAFALGKVIAQRAQRRGINRVVFDRGGRAYHGRVRALAEGARKGGLKF